MSIDTNIQMVRIIRMKILEFMLLINSYIRIDTLYFYLYHSYNSYIRIDTYKPYPFPVSFIIPSIIKKAMD